MEKAIKTIETIVTQHMTVHQFRTDGVDVDRVTNIVFDSIGPNPDHIVGTMIYDTALRIGIPRTYQDSLRF